MLRLAKVALVSALSTFALTGCSDRLIRSVVVHDGHLDRPAIEVPANIPFTLSAAAIDTPAASLSAREIGLAPTSLPNTLSPTLKPGQSLSAADIRTVELEIGPIPPGTYPLRIVIQDQLQSLPLIVK